LGPHAWVFIFDSAPSQVIQDPSSTPVYLLESVQKNMKATCDIAANLLNIVISQYGSSRLKPPPAPATDWILRPHGVTKMLLDRRCESRIVQLDRPSEEDSDDDIYPRGANFNIPQNVGRMDPEELPISEARSQPRPASPVSENEVMVWDNKDGPPLPDNFASTSPRRTNGD
jgi:hypothetical protein